MEQVRDLLVNFFENCDELGKIAVDRLPSGIRRTMNSWRNSVVSACTKKRFLSQILLSWSLLQAEKDSATAMKVLRDELKAVVNVQKAAIDEASNAKIIRVQGSQVRDPGMLEELASRMGSSFVDSLKNILSDLPPWAKVTLELIKEFLDSLKR